MTDGQIFVFGMGVSVLFLAGILSTIVRISNVIVKEEEAESPKSLLDHEQLKQGFQTQVPVPIPVKRIARARNSH